MGFLKTVVKVAKAVDKAQRAAAREQAKQQRLAAKELKSSLREIAKNQKSEEKRLKAEAKAEAEFQEDLANKYKVVKIRLTVDNDYDWVGGHIL